MKDLIIDSISQIDMRSLRLPEIAIHMHPSDYPNKYLARVFDREVPTNAIIIKDSLEELQKDIGENTNMVFLERTDKDVESMLGVWI